MWSVSVAKHVWGEGEHREGGCIRDGGGGGLSAKGCFLRH